MEDLGISAPVAPVDSGPAISTYVEPTTPSADVMSEMTELLDGNAPVESNIPTDKAVTPPAPKQAAPAAPPAAEAANPEAPPSTEAAPAGEPTLPEGVRLRTIDGKKAWVTDPELGQAMSARAALVDEAEKILGEPMTADGLKFRQDMTEGFEKMRSDMISDDPADQAKVIDHLVGVIELAAKNGEIGHDAASSFINVAIDKALASDSPLAQSVLNHISERLLGMGELPGTMLDQISGNQQVLKSVINSAYQAALTEKDPDVATALWHSAQQIEKNKFGTFRTVKEMDYLRTTGATSLPTYQRAETPKVTAPVQAAQPQPGTRPSQTPEAAQAFKTWTDTTNNGIHQEAVVKNVDAALDQAIDSALKDKYPNYYKAAQSQLVDAVRQGLLNDAQLRDQVAAAQKRASLAVSPDVRNQLQSMVIKQHAQAAQRILSEKKGPILSEFSALLKAKSTEDNQRAAASQRAGRQASPSGGPSASRQAVPPPSNGKFNSPSQFTTELENALA